MRKLTALLLLLTMLIPGACYAETPVEEAPAETPALTLPWDLSPGPVPGEDNYITDESGEHVAYQDETVTVTMERVVVGDSTFNVARIRIAHASQLRTGLANEKATRTNKISTMAKNQNAIVAIGGDYFSDAKNGYVVRMYNVYRKSPKSVYDMLLIDDQGNFHIILQSDPEELQALLATEGLTFPNAFHFGPAMIKDGVLLETAQYYIDNGNKYNIRSTSEPRCAIGQLGELEYMFVVVDGRRKDSDGCSVAELAAWMHEQGCQQAYNLDGGNSALMWFGGENYSDKTVKGERSVSDIIYISTAVPSEEE
ncbi:MAG: phosphodiester glycosidase family protein [Clostridia bacterium]|nr:phosphodiester glycosidase family protein [Clostridia bacterium]